MSSTYHVLVDVDLVVVVVVVFVHHHLGVVVDTVFYFVYVQLPYKLLTLRLVKHGKLTGVVLGVVILQKCLNVP